MIVLFKIAILYIHKMEFFDLVLFTQKNFWHSDYDSQEKLILADCKKLCAIFIVVLSFCTQGTCAGYMATPLLGKLSEYCRLLENIFAMMILGQVLFLAMIICLVGYQIFLVGILYVPTIRHVHLRFKNMIYCSLFRSAMR